jgi:hypothetical protein
LAKEKAASKEIEREDWMSLSLISRYPPMWEGPKRRGLLVLARVYWFTAFHNFKIFIKSLWFRFLFGHFDLPKKLPLPAQKVNSRYPENPTY